MVVMRARIATSHALDVYGGIRLAESALNQMAQQLKSGLVPMVFNHDYSKPLTALVLDAGVENLEDGEQAVWAEFDLPDDQWQEVEATFKNAGVPGGMSFSTSEPVGSQSSAAFMTVAADAHHYTDDSILLALTDLPPGSANAERYISSR